MSKKFNGICICVSVCMFVSFLSHFATEASLAKKKQILCINEMQFFLLTYYKHVLTKKNYTNFQWFLAIVYNSSNE